MPHSVLLIGSLTGKTSHFFEQDEDADIDLSHSDSAFPLHLRGEIDTSDDGEEILNCLASCELPSSDDASNQLKARSWSKTQVDLNRTSSMLQKRIWKLCEQPPN